MPITDPVADLFCSIKNAIAADKKYVVVNSSNMRKQILRILEEEKYVEKFSILEPSEEEKRKFEQIKIQIRYLENGESFIRGLKKVSKPGKRVYVNVSSIPVVLNHIGTALISTNKGILTDAAARKYNVGGEYIGKIW